MMKETELKPCPFCGGKIRLFHTEHFDTRRRRFDYNCLKCNAYISLMAISRYKSAKANAAEAVEIWNRRADNEQREAD